MCDAAIEKGGGVLTRRLTKRSKTDPALQHRGGPNSAVGALHRPGPAPTALGGLEGGEANQYPPAQGLHPRRRQPGQSGGSQRRVVRRGQSNRVPGGGGDASGAARGGIRASGAALPRLRRLEGCLLCCGGWSVTDFGSRTNRGTEGQKRHEATRFVTESRGLSVQNHCIRPAMPIVIQERPRKKIREKKKG